jgi:hypothetical protein
VCPLQNKVYKVNKAFGKRLMYRGAFGGFDITTMTDLALKAMPMGPEI